MQMQGGPTGVQNAIATQETQQRYTFDPVWNR